jgi:hypothetical protein
MSGRTVIWLAFTCKIFLLQLCDQLRQANPAQALL